MILFGTTTKSASFWTRFHNRSRLGMLLTCILGSISALTTRLLFTVSICIRLLLSKPKKARKCMWWWIIFSASQIMRDSRSCAKYQICTRLSQLRFLWESAETLLLLVLTTSCMFSRIINCSNLEYLIQWPPKLSGFGSTTRLRPLTLHRFPIINCTRCKILCSRANIFTFISSCCPMSKWVSLVALIRV